MLLLLATILTWSCQKEADVLAPVISGVEVDTVLNIGDKLVLAPNITNLVGIEYTWLVNGSEVASGQTYYIFTATEPGNFVVIFRAGNKGGTGEQAFKIRVEEPITITLENGLTTPMSRVLDIEPTISGPERDDYQYEWAIGDSIIGQSAALEFISVEAGEYTLTLTTTAGRQSASTSCEVKVEEAEYLNHAYIVLEYYPSPAAGFDWASMAGFNPLPYDEFLAFVEERKLERYTRGVLTLGSWGGYATLKFDHTVANVPGKTDLEVTATCTLLDPPTVYVAYDRNKNGIPDDDEWYEIKNSDYGMEDIPDYKITYSYMETDIDSDPDRFYTRFEWEDNQEEPQKGVVRSSTRCDAPLTVAGTIRTKGFFPGYYMKDKESKETVLVDGWANSFSRQGKRITKDITRAVTFSQRLNIDIGQAVDENGEPVYLPGIDFVKVRKSVYHFEQDFINTGGAMVDSNMDEGRMLRLTAIVDRHLH